MKTTIISLRRRHLMMLAAAGASAPASALTILRGGPALAPALGVAGLPRSGEKLIVSGRIVDEGGKPVSNAVVEAWHSKVHRTSVRSDGDGRLMFTTTTPAAREPISYRITRANGSLREGTLQLPANAAEREAMLAHLHRDDSGVWRSTFALTLV